MTTLKNKILKNIFLISTFLLLTHIFGWLQNTNNNPIDLDEIAWVNDAKIYDWRTNEKWQNFSWSKDNSRKPWNSADFRLFDQPHLTKYIYGNILSLKKIEPWNDSYYHQKNYQDFAQQKLSDKKYIDEIESKKFFGEKTIAAIETSRKISLTFGLSFFLLLFIFINSNSSTLSAIITTSLLMTNPIFQYNFKIATADSISMFFILLTLIIFYKLFFNKNKNNFIYLFISAITTALATSSKINGWILVIIFLIFNTIKLIKEEKINIKYFWQKNILWILIFINTYIYLQPELWNNSLIGIEHFFRQRITQQIIFSTTTSLNFLNYHLWIIRLFIESHTKNISLLKLSLFIISLVSLLIKLTTQKINLDWKKTSIITCIIISWLFFFSYAKVGFSRYTMWPLVLLATFTSLEIEKTIKTLIIKKIPHRFHIKVS
ncbi:MAG: hypothetical protein COU63_01920 [Candidatus Pacebacteria bacterium CG10_big_fil_rev_8_21_14_0_10_36_11]|nr:phospholipid carrier-dependent glycosyltransferase [Candidatus Pacearchaeota archaeon]OIP73663.1 MAG: hypothetical protein AUK08_03805 [Candidatus Pacebacteria bacterium CG2_30_36_39]PIR64755.1 MAG: hypothetical protein COU63_01920 [Candidatus Pacebacteria bacterium CG10_big_fil_rev_8_21_14_0_10_36_11]PJC43053.1 MAG: hypothetical protein CO040_01170 [Candidatus Pacebacteria bacterium CG_4_9_14_0_2_um_filter_36_8]